MESIKKLFDLSEYAKYLSSPYYESFTEIFNFFVLLALVILLLFRFTKLPPIKKALQTLKKNYNLDYKASHIDKLMPVCFRNCSHWILLIGFLFLSFISAIGVVYWSLWAVEAFFAESLKFNKFTTIFVLCALALVCFTLSVYFSKYANSIAKYIIKNKKINTLNTKIDSI